MSIVFLAVMSACIFPNLKGQDFTLMASSDNFEGFGLENPLSLPYANFRSPDVIDKKDARFYSTLLSKAYRKTEIYDLKMMEKITFYPIGLENVNNPANQDINIQFPGTIKKKFSFKEYNGYYYTLIDIVKGEKIQLGEITNGEIELNGIFGRQYLFIVHLEDEFHSRLIRLE